jgi:energy-coupling factor transporter transmembrane protein EcfT
MDELAYSSRMVDWSPLGKLLFTVLLLIAGLLTDSIVVPMITFCIGLALMAYSTNLKLPPVIVLAIAEAVLIMVIGCGMISILGDKSQPALMEGKLLWFDMYMTEDSFNQAWLVFFRAIAGVTLMLAFASSTPIPHLAQACRKLHLPREVTEMVVLIYRYAFLLLERMLVLIKAAKCRLGYGGSIRTARAYAGAMVGTFLFSTELAEKSDNALSCRNYLGVFPVYRKPRTVSAGWVIASVGCMAALLLFGQYVLDWNEMAGLFAPLFGWDV